MSITGKIKTLFSDKNKTEALFPRTKVSAVSDDNGVGLNVLLEQTVPMTRGGTGAENGAEGLANMFAAGSTVLSPYQYGTELPANPAVGQVYFEEATGTIADIGQDVARALRAVNLLDNSDFRNPVNQRSASNYSGSYNYTIDRWLINGYAITPTLAVIDGEGVSLKGQMLQAIEKIGINKSYTLAAMTSDGILCVSGVPTAGVYDGKGNTQLWIGTHPNDNNCVAVAIYTLDENIPITVEWAALYEGEYTIETLPPYMPKGYGTELAECQRYFLYNKSTIANEWPCICGIGTGASTNQVFIQYPIPAQMREGVVPSISWGGTINLLNKSNTSYVNVSSITAYPAQGRNIVWLDITASGVTAGEIYSLALRNGTGWIAISADL